MVERHAKQRAGFPTNFLRHRSTQRSAHWPDDRLALLAVRSNEADEIGFGGNSAASGRVSSSLRRVPRIHAAGLDKQVDAVVAAPQNQTLDRDGRH